ncbi:uncharacterized mitochondrial protein-like protein [Tanacetum coccineum]
MGGHFFLGLQVKQKPDGIFISQDKYVAKILKKFDFASVKTASTPIETQKPLVKDEEANDVDVHLYRYPKVTQKIYLSAVKSIFRLKGKPNTGAIWYLRESSLTWKSYSDSDYVFKSKKIAQVVRAWIKSKNSLVKHFEDMKDAYHWSSVYQLEVMLVNALTRFGESLRRVSDGAEAFLILTLFIFFFGQKVILSCTHFLNESLPDSSSAQPSVVPFEQQPDPSPSPSPKPSPRPSPTPIIPDSIPEPTGENLGDHSSNDTSHSGNEDDMTLQNIYDLCIFYVKEYLKIISLKQRFPKKSYSKVHKKNVSKQGRKKAKGESEVHRHPLFDEMPKDKIDQMETEDAQSEGRTGEMMDEVKEFDEQRLSTEDGVSTVKEGVSTDFEKVSTDSPKVSTDESKVILSCKEKFTEDNVKYDEKGRCEKFQKLESDEELARKFKSFGSRKKKEIRLLKKRTNEALNQKLCDIRPELRSDEDFIAIGSVEDDKLITKMNKKDSSKEEEINQESKEEVKQEDKEEENTRKRKHSTRKKMKSRKRRFKQDTSQDDPSDTEKENEELRLCLTIAPDEDKEVDYEILDKKYPIIDWKTENLGTKPQFDESKRTEEINMNVVTRSNGQKRSFSTLIGVLSVFDREDLNAIYKLVMDIYQDRIPEGFDKVLWGDLIVMFNPDEQMSFGTNNMNGKIIKYKNDGSLSNARYDNEALASPNTNDEELSIPEQTATGKGTSNLLMVGSLPKTTKPT